MNIGVILAAGQSTRFLHDIPKQIYPINDKPIINYSIDALSQLDDIIIITNSNCSKQIKTNYKIITTDSNSRLDSIKTAIYYLKDKSIDNILIHDAARPFITSNHIQTLIKSSNDYQHSQYYLKIVNGLARITDNGWEIPNRDEFIELTTPQITNYQLFKYIFKNWIETGKECEILPILKLMNLNSNLIEGNLRDLRKITTLEDIY